MTVQNHTYYFGKVPEAYIEESSPLTSDWNQDYYFRFRLVPQEQEVKFEDSCGRMVPFCYDALYEMHSVLTRLIVELQASIIGQPLK